MHESPDWRPLAHIQPDPLPGGSHRLINPPWGHDPDSTPLIAFNPHAEYRLTYQPGTQLWRLDGRTRPDTTTSTPLVWVPLAATLNDGAHIVTAPLHKNADGHTVGPFTYHPDRTYYFEYAPEHNAWALAAATP